MHDLEPYRDGIGARVTIAHGDQTQMRVVQLDVGFMSCDMPTAHLGLGAKDAVDGLTIRWRDRRGTANRGGWTRAGNMA